MKLKTAIERPDLTLAEKVEYSRGPEDDGNYLKFYLPDSIIVVVKIPDEGLIWGKKKLMGL